MCKDLRRRARKLAQVGDEGVPRQVVGDLAILGEQVGRACAGCDQGCWQSATASGQLLADLEAQQATHAVSEDDEAFGVVLFDGIGQSPDDGVDVVQRRLTEAASPAGQGGDVKVNVGMDDFLQGAQGGGGSACVGQREKMCVVR